MVAGIKMKKIKCEHKWAYLGPVWEFGNVYREAFMCVKCFAEKRESPYEVNGRNRIALSEEKFKDMKGGKNGRERINTGKNL
jgi:hypothetical protein